MDCGSTPELFLLLMNKEYKTVEELMNILSSKGMNFSQPIRSKRLLMHSNYYCLTAFKHLLYKTNTSTYKDGVDFEHLYNVYLFDKALKTTILKHLLYIEQKIKSCISDQISYKYGYKDNSYLAKKNYDQSNHYLDSTLKKIRNQRTIYGDKNESVKHYKEKYGYVPFWVLSKCLTIGVIRDYFQILKPSDQDYIVKKLLEKQIPIKPVKIFKVMLAMIADFRNMCAHDEALLNYKHNRLTLPPLQEHSILNITYNGSGIYNHGSKDILAIFITIKYLVNATMYNEFIQDVSSIINKYYKRLSNVVSKDDFLDYIGLANNYDVLRTSK